MKTLGDLWIETLAEAHSFLREASVALEETKAILEDDTDHRFGESQEIRFRREWHRVSERVRAAWAKLQKMEEERQAIGYGESR